MSASPIFCSAPKFPDKQTIRSGFLKVALLGVLGVALLPEVCPGQEPAARKPNVVILLIDDLGYGDLACFGNPRIPTPHIDSLAASGIKCTMSYITNPPCSPSRCSLLTGMYPQRFGKSGMARGMPIPEDHPTLAEFMRDVGYVTGHIGKWDIGSDRQGPLQRGFTQVAKRPPGRYTTRREDGTPAYLTDVDGDYMAEFVTRNKEKPFFLYFSPLAIHSPLHDTPRSYRERVKGGKGTAYEGAVVAVDDAVGKLLAALKKENLEKDTLIFLTGDNGANIEEGGSSAPYRGGKFAGATQFEGWVHTPMIVSWPGALPAGGTYAGLMCTLDLYATAAAAAAKPPPARCEGNNLLPYLKAEKAGDAHEFLYWHNADPSDKKHRHLSAVRWKNWRLVKYDNSWRLFDIEKDPREKKDLANDQPGVAETMREKHQAFVATLPPVKRGSSFSGNGGTLPSGWGWVFGDGKMPAPAPGNPGTDEPESE